MAVGAFPVQATDKWCKSTDQRDLISTGNHFIYLRSAHSDGIAQYCAGEDKERYTKGKQLLLVSEAGAHMFVDVFNKTCSRSKQCGGCAGLDCRQQCTKENDLRD